MTSKTIEFPYLDSVRLFEHVANQPWAVWLDSGILTKSSKTSAYARYDVLACQPMTTLVTEGEVTKVNKRLKSDAFKGVFIQSTAKVSKTDPVELLKSYLPSITGAHRNVDYLNGAIGYFAYDLARRFETLPLAALDDEQLPWMSVGIYDVLVVIDHCNQTTQLITYYAENESGEVDKLIEFWRQLIEAELQRENLQLAPRFPKTESYVMQHNMSRTEYDTKFQRVQDYIVAGDCYQINLAKRFSIETKQDPWVLYQSLRQHSPAPFGAYINLPFATVLSNSPESFIRCRDRQVVTNPIKGTRPRDHSNSKRDQEIADALYNSEKDRAENLMIVDLMRNDLSRCCELGSVKTPRLFEVHSFANVHHLISKITGVLKKQHHALDLLRSCFPGGSITGAPKVRAMQIIEELEPNRRGLYCGAIGYVGMNGNMETNIAIRTIVIKEGVARYSAGGGLVLDSKSDEEYQEIIDKASMMNGLFEQNID